MQRIDKTNKDKTRTGLNIRETLDLTNDQQKWRSSICNYRCHLAGLKTDDENDTKIYFKYRKSTHYNSISWHFLTQAPKEVAIYMYRPSLKHCRQYTAEQMMQVYTRELQAKLSCYLTNIITEGINHYVNFNEKTMHSTSTALHIWSHKK